MRREKERETKRGGNGEVEGESERANIAHVCFNGGARDSVFPFPFPKRVASAAAACLV